MLRVVESNRFEELAAALADALADVADPFAPPLVAVPNRVVGRWLQYAIATRTQIAAGYRQVFFDELVAATLSGDGFAPLDKARLEAVCASVLADDVLLAEPVMAEPRDFLDADGEERRGPRRVQLAAQLADRMWQYALTRPDWLDAWERGVAADLGEHDEVLAAWQSRVWRAICERITLVPTPRMASVRRRAGLAAPGGVPVFVVGFSYQPRAYLDTLAYLAETRDVHVLAFSPCAEYWGDVERRGRKRLAVAAADPIALERWGAPGRDYLAALAALSQGDIDDRFVDATADAAVATARDLWSFDTLVRAAPGAAVADRGAARGPGVELLACPSVAREVEIVASEIVRMLREDPEMRANEIAVLLPPGATDPYLGQIPAIFGALDLPFHVVDAPAVGHGHVAEAAGLLLSLPLGTFRRPELLGFMTHPAVQARHPHVDPADWVRWAEALGVVHGADGADHQGTYLEGEEHFHWEQGLRRLALGAFMAGAASNHDAIARLADRTYLPEELAADEQPAAATFALLARSLIADARWLRTQRRPLASWAEVLDALVVAYLGARGDRGTAELARVRGALTSLADLDLDGRLLDWREVHALAARRLAEVKGDRGEPLAHGVHVARLVPHRPLPFNAVFALGLGEEHFPASDRPPALDLRRGRRAGDVSPRERDRYAFLETLLAARGRLTLSFVAREPVTGEPRSPSAVIHELAEMLAPYVGTATPAEVLKHITVEHPLHRFDPRYADPRLTTSAAPTVSRERAASDMRATVERAASCRKLTVPSPRHLRRAIVDTPALGPVARALGLGLGRDLPAASAETPLVLRLSALRKFLESAPQGWAQAVLRLDQEDDEDPVDRDEEPMVLAPIERAMVGRATFTRYLAGEPLDAAFARTWDRLRLSGAAPVGVFGDAAKKKLWELVQRWGAELEHHGGRAQTFTVFGLGRRPTALARMLPPLVLTVEVGGVARRIELVGTSEPWGEQCGSLVLVPSKAAWRHKLRAAVDHVALAAAGQFQFGSKHLILDREGAHAARHERWSPEDARRYLTDLVHDLYATGHEYLMSVDMSNASLEGKPVKADEPADGRPGSIGYGPLRPSDDLEPPPPEALAAMAERRFAPLARRIKEMT